MDQALSRKRFEWPAIPFSKWSDPIAVPDPLLNQSRTLAKVRILRARCFAATGRPAEAVGEFVAIRRFGTALLSGRPLLIAHLVGTAVEAMGTKGLVRFCQNRRIPASALRIALKDLPRPSLVDPHFALALKVEFNDFLVDSIERATVAQLADANFSIDPEEASGSAEKTWPLEDPDLLDRPATVRLSGRIYVRRVLSALRPRPRRDRSIESFAQSLTSAAPKLPMVSPGEGLEPEPSTNPAVVAAFRKRAREVPNALGLSIVREGAVMDYQTSALFRLIGIELVRAWLISATSRLSPGNLPIDPATGRSLRHDPKRRLVWSVGPNGRDENGSGDDRSEQLPN